MENIFVAELPIWNKQILPSGHCSIGKAYFKHFIWGWNISVKYLVNYHYYLKTKTLKFYWGGGKEKSS